MSAIAILRPLIVDPTIPLGFAPAFISVKDNSVPTAFQTTYQRDFAGYAVKDTEDRREQGRITMIPEKGGILAELLASTSRSPDSPPPLRPMGTATAQT